MDVRTILPLVALCLSTACDDSTAPLLDLGAVPDGHFTTDVTGYRATSIPGPYGPRHRFTVITRFENRGASSVFLGRCYHDSSKPLFGVTIDEPADEESGFDQVWACVGHDQQFEIAPGQVRIDTLVVEGPNAWDGHTHEPLGVTNGIFRVYFDVRTAPGDGAPQAPMTLRLSNPFRVQTE